MSTKRLVNNYWFSRVVLVIWIVSAAFILFLLSRIDLIVHGQLYNFSLQFSPDWANPYWAYTRLIYVSLGLPMALSVFVIALGFTKKTDKVPESAAKQEPKPQPVVSEERKARETNMVISCPACKKVFTRPLVMLNFEGGKTRLVNVCPYCNHVLGSAENGKSPESDVHIADVDKKLTH